MKNVAIFGVPRSGTSWLGQLFNSSAHTAYRFQPIFAYTFDGAISKESSKQDIYQFHQSLLQTDDDFVCQHKNISGNSTPSFSKKNITHLVWKEVRYLEIINNLIKKTDTKVIGIVRHPCGVIYSWKNTLKEFEKNWDILEEWESADKKNKTKHDFYGFEKWVEATELFLNLRKEFPEQFYIQGYEQLANNPLSHIRELFNFCGLALGQQTKDFISESTTSTSDDPYDVFRKNKTGFEWINQLNPIIIDEIKSDDRFIKIEKHFGWNTLEQKSQ